MADREAEAANAATGTFTVSQFIGQRPPTEGLTASALIAPRITRDGVTTANTPNMVSLSGGQ